MMFIRQGYGWRVTGPGARQKLIKMERSRIGSRIIAEKARLNDSVGQARRPACRQAGFYDD